MFIALITEDHPSPVMRRKSSITNEHTGSSYPNPTSYEILHFTTLLEDSHLGSSITKTRTRRSKIAQNITVDDTLGDPMNNNHFIYSPDSLWKPGNGCPSCTVRPDPSLASNETWHDTTFFPPSSGEDPPLIHSASIQFNGIEQLHCAC